MNAQWVFGWWNLIFVLPFGLALVYLGLYTLSGVTFGDADADVSAEADLHADVDADADADVHVDVDADADADIHADVDADADADMGADADVHADVDHPSIDQTPAEAVSGGGHFSALAVLGWLGVGRVPVSIVAMVLFLCWGSIGFVANAMLWPKVGEPGRLVLFSLPLALLGSVLITRGVVQLIGRFLPTNETYAIRRHELLGSTGEAIFNIDNDSGLVSLRDSRGDLFQVPCRVYKDRGPIAKGSIVKLVAYNGKQGLFYAVTANQKSEQTV